MVDKITCLVTLHGVGFEQPPQTDVVNSGYADILHQHLKKYLGDQLSDDPGRERTRAGENGVIYVESRWPDQVTGEVSSEIGMKRLGSWNTGQTRVDIRNAPLVANREPVSHLALIYSNLEPESRRVSSSLLTLAMGLFSFPRYASLPGFARLSLNNLRAIFSPPVRHAEEAISLRPRTDRNRRQTGLMGLEDDVAGYVCDNEERERVRSFVAEALTRLAYRTDVEHIILNTHSNGTVIAFDILRHLPEDVIDKIKVFVTSGSPLRKYVDLFSWGKEIQTNSTLDPWYNFYDPRDPVGDRLEPPVSWRVGQPVPVSDETLFSRIDFNSEQSHRVHITDLSVDNVQWSTGSGLRAHNYWDNEAQFVPQLAEMVRAVVKQQPIRVVGTEHAHKIA